MMAKCTSWLHAGFLWLSLASVLIEAEEFVVERRATTQPLCYWKYNNILSLADKYGPCGNPASNVCSCSCSLQAVCGLIEAATMHFVAGCYVLAHVLICIIPLIGHPFLLQRWGFLYGQHYLQRPWGFARWRVRLYVLCISILLSRDYLWPISPSPSSVYTPS
jgi:hypothetical protein